MFRLYRKKFDVWPGPKRPKRRQQRQKENRFMIKTTAPHMHHTF